MSRLILPALLVAKLASAELQPAPSKCPDQDSTLCGRYHFEQGTQAFEKGDFNLAAAEFEAAIAARAHPVIRFNLALSLARLGRPTAAIQQLRLVQSDTEADKPLRDRAAREQRGAEQSLARVSFRLADPAHERVELDGAPIDLQGQAELAIDPGPHHVRIISGNSVVLDQDLELSPGERVELRVGERSRRIDVVVVPADPPPLVAPPAAVRPQPLPPAAKAPSQLAPAWFYVGAGASVVLVGVTVWSGLDTQDALNDYERDLSTLTQTQADERVSDGHARELRTNLLLGASVVCAASTAVLGIWFVDWAGKGRASVGVSPTSVALSGSF